MGKNIDTTDIITEVPVSTVVKIGFAKPPVLVLEVSLAAAVFPLITEAVPPPAIIASVQVNIGLKSDIVAAIIKVPAKVANGKAIVSSKLSNHGI